MVCLRVIAMTPGPASRADKKIISRIGCGRSVVNFSA
jgi:hypothetical protein